MFITKDYQFIIGLRLEFTYALCTSLMLCLYKSMQDSLCGQSVILPYYYAKCKCLIKMKLITIQVHYVNSYIKIMHGFQNPTVIKVRLIKFCFFYCFLTKEAEINLSDILEVGFPSYLYFQRRYINLTSKLDTVESVRRG